MFRMSEKSSVMFYTLSLKFQHNFINAKNNRIERKPWDCKCATKWLLTVSAMISLRKNPQDSFRRSRKIVKKAWNFRQKIPPQWIIAIVAYSCFCSARFPVRFCQRPSEQFFPQTCSNPSCFSIPQEWGSTFSSAAMFFSIPIGFWFRKLAQNSAHYSVLLFIQRLSGKVRVFWPFKIPLFQSVFVPTEWVSTIVGNGIV